LWSVPHAHSPGATVTSLWSPATATPDHDQFVSGGTDFRVIVWHATTGAQIHCFTQHSARVERIIGPPKKDKRWRHCFLSVGGDAVCLFSLQNYNCQYLFAGHTAAIDSIVWREDQDFLIVGCCDGAVFVWELGTGALVQRGRSDRSLETLRSGPNLMTARGQSARRGPLRVRPHHRLAVISLDVRALLAKGATSSRWSAWLMPWNVNMIFFFPLLVLCF
jgi:WD40 repeat protein